MSRLRALPLLLTPLLAGCAYIAPIQPASTFYVMRHLEAPAGTPDPELSAEGRRQAELLAERFAANPPAAIFVSDTRRARQTVAPLAARLGLTPRIYNPADTRGLVTEIMKEPPPVLVVGHGNTVPEIVQALSGTRTAPIAEGAFGEFWEIGGNRRTVTRQRLIQ